MSDLVILDEEKLRRLASIIYHQEVDAINSINFQSEPELARYLRDCRSGYESVVSLLDSSSQLQQRWQNDETRSPIAHDIFDYAVASANNALQTVRNYTLRMNYLQKIREHSGMLMTALEELDGNVINVRRLAKDATLYRNAMMEYTRKYQSTASRNFSKSLKETGLKFPELVQRYQSKLNLHGPFNNLEDAQKLQVYEEIIEASGRGRAVVNQLSRAFGVAGIAVLVFTAGMMVWDIFSSEHVLQTATRDVVVTAASVGGAMLGEVIGVALTTQLVGVEASPLFLVMAGLATGIAGAFILGAFAGLLIDLIFGSGGSSP